MQKYQTENKYHCIQKAVAFRIFTQWTIIAIDFKSYWFFIEKFLILDIKQLLRNLESQIFFIMFIYMFDNDLIKKEGGKNEIEFMGQNYEKIVHCVSNSLFFLNE